MITSKSPRRVLLTAHHVAKQALPEYSSKFSRKDYTLPQLFACLVLKEHQRKDYRGCEQLLLDCPGLGHAIGMPLAPGHTALKRASGRLLKLPRARRPLDALVAFARACRVLGRSVALAAMDASGFEARRASAYFVRRRAGGRRLDPAAARPEQATAYRRFPELALVADCRTHLALSSVTGAGPGPDQPHFERALFEAWRRVPGRLYGLAADAGYGAEWAHELARRDMGVRTLIPAKAGRPTAKAGRPTAKAGRPTAEPATGRWRRHMGRLLGTEAARRRCGYTRRWQAETVNSMIKRNQGSALRARSSNTRNRELALRVLTHNVSLLRRRVATQHS